MLTQWKFSGLLVATVALVSGGACTPGGQPGTDGLTVGITDHPECDLHSTEWIETRDQVLLSGPNLSLPGIITNVIEFHDCQRFLVESSGVLEYGGLFAIYAGKRLDSLEHDLQDVDGGESGLAALAGAEIWAEDDYAPLNIEPGFNCLYLSKLTPDPSASWKAWMVPHGPTEPDCSAPVNTSEFATGSDLKVLRGSILGGNPAADEHYPEVARWGFQKARNEHYVVMKCGVGACQIGSRAFSPEPPLSQYSDPAAPPRQRRVFEVESWYDEQLLAAMPATGTGGSPKPTSLHSQVIPDPNLGDHTDTLDFKDRWVPVARVAMSAHSNEYVDKFNFGATTPKALNVIEACHAVDGCPEFPLTCDPSMSMRVRITNAEGGEVRYKCVTYRSFPPEVISAGIHVPATARWRWRDDDETVWFRCAQGCCEVE